MTAPTKTYQVWQDGGYESFHFNEFDTIAEVSDYLLQGASYGQPMFVTRLQKVIIRLTDIEE